MNSEIEKVAVIGLGYIGLPTAAVLASRGLQVHGVDVNPAVVEKINRGEVHIVEPDLDMLVRAGVQSGHLRASLEPESADVFVIAVPTPFKGDHEPDLSYVWSAAERLAPHLKKGDLVVLESTSPVGTAEALAERLAAARPDLAFPGVGREEADVAVAYCPERVLPGKVVRELVENDRIIGGITPRCARRASDFYRIFVEGECIETDARTAEMCKLTENAFRDVNIAFANELSIICDRLGIDVWELIRLANRHPRVDILQPGPGVGGHCIAVDPWFIVSSTPEEARLIRTAREINDGKPDFVIERVLDAVNRQEGPIACLGLAFKANIDDLRESPAMAIVSRLSDLLDRELLVVEPHVDELPEALRGRANIVWSSLDDALEKAGIVLLLVDHDRFRKIPGDVVAGKWVIDTRGVWR